MRVLLMADWPLLEGGTERYIEWVRSALEASGDEVKLLTGSTGTAGGGTADYVAPSSDRLSMQAVLQIANPRAAAQARAAIRDFSPDAVLVTTFLTHLSPAILAPLRRVPTVVVVMDYRPVCPIATRLLPDGSICAEKAGLVCRHHGCVSLAHWLRDRPRYALLRRGLASVDRVLACSDWMRRCLREGGIESESIVLPVPRPSPRFHRSPTERPRFAYIGRLRSEKGVDLLLTAFAQIASTWPEAELSVLGDGPDRPDLERLVATLGLGGVVRFAGWVDPSEVEAELAQAWALVAPSMWAEPLGLSALEAVVRGVPVIAPAAGGFEETIEPGATGLLFPRGDAVALAERLVSIASGEAFPSRSLMPSAIERVRDRHDLTRHVMSLHEHFGSINRVRGSLGTKADPSDPSA